MAAYVQLGDVRTYYEEDGAGEPLLLLHPGMADSRAWEGNMPGLAERFHVFRPDRRGHGRTPDVAGPITYELMARDTIATILTQLVMHGVEHRAHVGTILGANGIEPPDLDSWSHGIRIHGDDWPPDWGPEPAER